MQTYIIYISTRPFAVGVHFGFSYFSDLPLVIRRLKMSAISGDVPKVLFLTCNST